MFKMFSNQKESAEASADQIMSKVIEDNFAVIRFNLEGVIQSANPLFCRAMGYTQEELIGRHHKIFCDAKWVSSPDYQSFWNKLRSGETFSASVSRLNKSQNYVYLEASYIPLLKDGRAVEVIKVAKDITQSHLADLNNKNKIEAINKTFAWIEFDTKGVILNANKNFTDAMGFSLGEIVGKHHRIFCDPAYLQTNEYKSFWAELGDGKSKVGKFERFKKNKESIWLEGSYNPIYNDDGVCTGVFKWSAT